MKGFKQILVAALLLMLLVSACAMPAGLAEEQSAERALSMVRQSYRGASFVLRGTAVQNHVDSDGNLCSDVEVTDVLAGNAESGQVIHCVEGNLKENEEYLLFLERGKDVFYSEDSAPYRVLSHDAIKIEPDGLETLKDLGIDLDDIRAELQKLDAVVGIPSKIYFYNDLYGLASAADEIFVGRVTGDPSLLSETSFRAQENGGMVEQSLPASIVRVTAFGAIKGSLKYGDPVSLVYSPSLGLDAVDAATLKPLSQSQKNAPALEKNQTYLFFLIKGPDAKQNYYFSANPYQGYVKLVGDALEVPYQNAALRAFGALTPLVSEIRSLLNI